MVASNHLIKSINHRILSIRFNLNPMKNKIKDELRVTFCGRCNNLVLVLFITSSHSASNFMTSKQVTSPPWNKQNGSFTAKKWFGYQHQGQ